MRSQVVKLPRQSMWPIPSQAGRVVVVDLLARLGQALCPTDPLLTVREETDNDSETWDVTCPFAGTLSRFSTEIGRTASEGTPLCEINTDVQPDKRLLSLTTNASIMGRSRALVEDVLAITELLKRNPTHELGKFERQILQEWSNCTDWFFVEYGGKICQFAVSLLHRHGSPRVRQDAEDLATNVMLTVRREWERGVLLNAYLANCRRNQGTEVSTLFRTYLMGRVRFRIRDAIKQGIVEPNLSPEGPEIEDLAARSEDGVEDELWEIIAETPQAALNRWSKRLAQSMGDRDKRRLKYWLDPATLAQQSTSTKVEGYPDDLRDGRMPRSIEREWTRKILGPLILVGYDEFKNGIPSPSDRSVSDDLLSRSIALVLHGNRILVAPESVSHVIAVSRGVKGEAG